MKKSKFGALIFLGFAALALAQIYKWVDEEGGVHFGDSPPEKIEAEKLELPQGPSEAVIREAQENLRKSLEKRRLADEAREAERQAREAATIANAEPKAGIEPFRNEEFVCFMPLGALVEGESAHPFDAITPTELTREQRESLKDLFGGIEESWRGEIREVVCKGSPSEPDSTSLEFEVKTSVVWSAGKSQLLVETESSGKDDKSRTLLTQIYKVGDTLYFRDQKKHRWSNMAAKGNKVEIVAVEPNILTFLRKHRVTRIVGPDAKRSFLRSEIRYLEVTRRKFIFKEVFFVNNTLVGWRTWILQN